MSQRRDILEGLLEIEKARLATAVRIEAERNIVFPETSVIIHDVLKLVNALYPDSGGQSPPKPAVLADDVDDLMLNKAAP